jgi:hypothetical protein
MDDESIQNLTSVLRVPSRTEGLTVRQRISQLPPQYTNVLHAKSSQLVGRFRLFRRAKWLRCCKVWRPTISTCVQLVTEAVLRLMFIFEIFFEWILTGVVYKSFAQFAAKRRLRRYKDGAAVAVPGWVEGGDVVFRHSGFLIAKGGDLVSSTDASGSFSRSRLPRPESGTAVKVADSNSRQPWQKVPRVVYSSAGCTIALYVRPQDLPLIMAVLETEPESSSRP